MSNSAFFYVDGEPTKGTWIEIDSSTDTDDVIEALADAGWIKRDENGETDYGGDLLVADIEGDLTRAFYSSTSDTLDLAGLTEVLEFCESNSVDEDAVAAYLDDRGTWSQSDFEDAYMGKHDSEKAFTESWADDNGLLDSVPENLRSYFDYEAYARDLFIDDFTFSNGFVFRRN